MSCLTAPSLRRRPLVSTGCHAMERLSSLNKIRNSPHFMKPASSLPHSQPVPILSQIDPVHAPHPTSRRSILILFPHLRLCLTSGFLLSGLPAKALYTPLMAPTRATCPAHLNPPYMITRMIFGEEYRAQSSLLCSLLQSPVTSSLLGPNILLSTLF